MPMNTDMSYIMQSAILDLYSSVKPRYDGWRSSITGNRNTDPLGWMYLEATERVIKKRMEEAGVEMELFDDLYFAICWEIRERSMAMA